MNAPDVIYDILSADATVGPLVINSGNSNNPYRIYLGYARNGETKPFIIFRPVLSDENQTKSGASDLDEWEVEIDIYHNTHALGATVAQAVRDALEAFSGTVNGVIVQGGLLTNIQPDQDIDNLPIWTVDLRMRIAS